MKKAWMSASLLALLTLVVTIITACAGKDPGDGKLDKYQKQFTGAVTPEKGESANVEACKDPQISVVPDASSQLMTFIEDKEGSYQVVVRSFQGENFTVETSNLQPGMSSDFAAGRAKFTPEQANGSQKIFKFKWKPGKLKGPQAEIQAMGIKYSAKASGKMCNPTTVMVNLVVQPDSSAKGGGK